MSEKKSTGNLLDWVNRVKGDKLVLMIVIMLMLFSIVCIFSSTSQMAVKGRTRIDILSSQLIFTALGTLVIFICYKVNDLKVFRKVARMGFWISFFLVTLLLTHNENIPILKPGQINHAWRVLKIHGFTLHVFEVAKVMMVMYIAWAVDTFKKHDFRLINKLGEHEKFRWLKNEFVQKLIYIYLPMSIITLEIMPGSNSSAVFIAVIMVVTVIVGGGMKIREFFLLGGLALIMLLGIITVYKVSDGNKFERIATGISRTEGYEEHINTFMQSKLASEEYYKSLKYFQQPYAARQAIKEGGLMGKGAGGSTQKYATTMMFEDFMYSFVIEEYGLMGGLIVLVLFLSLLARGEIIARNCDDNFGKMAVAGLVILISFQALMHMCVNVGMIPMTGQTLPMISHGRSAFIMFCGAFGVILSISKITAKKVEKERKSEGTIIESKDEVQNRLYDLDNMENKL